MFSCSGSGTPTRKTTCLQIGLHFLCCSNSYLTTCWTVSTSPCSRTHNLCSRPSLPPSLLFPRPWLWVCCGKLHQRWRYWEFSLSGFDKFAKLLYSCYLLLPPARRWDWHGFSSTVSEISPQIVCCWIAWLGVSSELWGCYYQFSNWTAIPLS